MANTEEFNSKELKQFNTKIKLNAAKNRSGIKFHKYFSFYYMVFFLVSQTIFFLHLNSNSAAAFFIETCL